MLLLPLAGGGAEIGYTYARNAKCCWVALEMQPLKHIPISHPAARHNDCPLWPQAGGQSGLFK